jgi:hypothetical protein
MMNEVRKVFILIFPYQKESFVLYLINESIFKVHCKKIFELVIYVLFQVFPMIHELESRDIFE